VNSFWNETRSSDKEESLKGLPILIWTA